MSKTIRKTNEYKNTRKKVLKPYKREKFTY